MEFEPIEVIFMVIWCFFLFKAVFGGRRKKKLPELPEESPSENSPIEAEESSYDYERLRRKIRKSWGEESSPTPVVLDDKKEEQKEKNKSLYSFPLSATIGENLKPSLKKGTDFSDSCKTKDRIQAGQRPSPGASLLSKSWTAADVEKWVAYEAVFGAPRAKKSWQPYSQK